MSLFRAAHGKGSALPKICHIYPTMMKLGYTLSKEDLKNI